ncbi:MAG TPA: hypothetical protein VGC05_18520 [Mycobacterium sp.]
METNNLISLVAGIVAIVVGPLVTIFRNRIAGVTRVGQRATFGKIADDPNTIRRSTSSIGVVGIVFVVIGIGFILMALFRHSW